MTLETTRGNHDLKLRKFKNLTWSYELICKGKVR